MTAYAGSSSRGGPLNSLLIAPYKEDVGGSRSSAPTACSLTLAALRGRFAHLALPPAAVHAPRRLLSSVRRKCSDVLWRIWADIGYCGGPGMVAFAHRAHRIVGLPRHRQLRHLRRSKSPFRVLVVRLPPVIHPEVDAEGFRTGDNRFAAERPTPPGRCNSPARQSIVPGGGCCPDRSPARRTASDDVADRAWGRVSER